MQNAKKLQKNWKKKLPNVNKHFDRQTNALMRREMKTNIEN